MEAVADLTSDLSQLGPIRAFVRDFCLALPPPAMEEESIDQLLLAVNEAATNIMKHAYGGRGGQPIHLRATADAGQVTISLTHHGVPPPSAPAQEPAFDGSRESGFGLYIISQCVDEVRYQQDEEGRNVVCLVKNRSHGDTVCVVKHGPSC